MSDITSKQSGVARDLQKQAVEWVVNRHIAENWSDHDQNRLDAWLNESPAHLVAYWRAKDGWSRTELLSALRSFRPDRSDSPAGKLDAMDAPCRDGRRGRRDRCGRNGLFLEACRA